MKDSKVKNRTAKRQIKGKGMPVLLLFLVLLTACAGKRKDQSTDTPQEAAQRTMEAVKVLDLETFNACTDNYEGACWNFIGFPVEKEYKVFNELLQPHFIKGKRYREKLAFTETMVEELTWEIGRVEEVGSDKARIEMKVTNRDISEALDRFEEWIIEDMSNDAEKSAAALLWNVADVLNGCDDDLKQFIEETENTWTGEVTVTAYMEDGGWKLHLTDEFINAFMGNIGREL